MQFSGNRNWRSSEENSLGAMERRGRAKGASYMSLISKAATFSVPQPPRSPGRWSDKSFSGPIGSIIPKDAQLRKRGGSTRREEPSSPKISCVGQIKIKKKKKKPKKEKEKKKKKRRFFTSCFGCLFRRKAAAEEETTEKTTTTTTKEKKKMKKRMSAVASTPAPPLRPGEMRRYQSGREALAGFDWRKAMKEDFREEEEEEEVILPHSAPILIGRASSSLELQPKKEVNLWRRRRDAQPPIPLQIRRTEDITIS